MIEMARSLLKEMQLPGQFWGDAVRHAIYLLNRLPTRAVTDITPYEAWSGQKPHIGHVRVFGCVAHMRISSVRKLDDRSKVVIHLGKEPGTKANRLYDPVNKVVHVSRDVSFEETKSWLWKQNEKNQTPQKETFIVSGTGASEFREVETEERNGTQDHVAENSPETPTES